MTWNEDRERLIAAAELGDATPRIAADLLVAARKRAFEAEHKAQQLQAELDSLKAAHAWIKTSERLPELSTPVLGIDLLGEVDVLECVPAFHGGTEWQYVTGHHGSAGEVTDWMPLPVRPR